MSTATIIRVEGHRRLIRVEDGSQQSAIVRGRKQHPVAGDNVEVSCQKDGTWVVESIDPRTSEFCRADHHGRKQIIAANIEQVVITIAPEPVPSRDLPGAYLSACNLLDIPAIFVINKMDLMPEYTEDIIHLYKSWADENNIRVIEASSKERTGLTELISACKGLNTILVGQSGAGKSSLIQELIPDLEIKTGALAKLTGKGAHTTTATTLYELEGEAFIYDSPGVWEYGLWQIDEIDLAHSFVDFEPYIGNCKFSNCTHNHEPICAIKQAVEDKEIHEWRWQSYLRILRNL